MDNSENSERPLKFEVTYSGQGVYKQRHILLRKNGLSTGVKDRILTKKSSEGY